MRWLLSLTGMWLEPGTGLPALGWVEGGSKGAVPSTEARCTRLTVGICPAEGLPPSLPSVPHALGLPLWTLGDLSLGVRGSILVLRSLCWLPAPLALGGGEGGAAIHTASHLPRGFANGLVFVFAGSVQGVYGAGRGYAWVPLVAWPGARQEVLLRHLPLD